MKTNFFRRILLSIVVFTNLQIYFCYSQSVVCRKKSIQGFDRELAIGHQVCGTNTSRASEANLYLTINDNFLYVQSNFITEGFDNPTKIATTDIVDIETIVENILYANQSEVDWNKINSLIKNEITFTIDTKLLNDSKYGSLSLEHTGKLNFRCPDGIVRSSLKIKNKSEGYDFLIKCSEQLSTRIKNQNLNYIFSNLKDQKIDFSKIKIMLLSENSSTKEILANKFANKSIPFDFSSKEYFKKLLLNYKGSRTIIIGHIEDGDFVTLDKNGAEIFRISIDEIQKFQKENKLELILLGCKSALEGAAAGPLNKFNSVDALNRLAKTEKTETVEEFIDSLALGTMHFVIDETFFQAEQVLKSSGEDENTLPERVEISVYNKTDKALKLIKTPTIGKIIFLGLGVTELTLQNNIPIDSSNNQNGDHRNNNDKPKNGGSDTFLYLIIAAILIGIGGYLFKSSKKK